MASLVRAFVLAMTLLTLGYPLANAKLFAMRPLDARQVYRLLKQSGRSDAIPEGRVITQGLAAMTGFALGLTKGLGTALLFDIITANVTDLNVPGVTSASSNNVGTRLKTQEICFNSRSARSFEEAEAIAEAYSRDDNIGKEKYKVRSSEVERRVKRKRRNKRKPHRHRKPSRLALTKPALATATGTQTGTATDTETTDPTTTAATATMTDNDARKSPVITEIVEANPAVGTAGSGTSIDNGGGTGTTSTSTTSTGRDGAINCVVIQKPEGR